MFLVVLSFNSSKQLKIFSNLSEIGDMDYLNIEIGLKENRKWYKKGCEKNLKEGGKFQFRYDKDIKEAVKLLFKGKPFQIRAKFKFLKRQCTGY